jgi:hypothetical protein
MIRVDGEAAMTVNLYAEEPDDPADWVNAEDLEDLEDLEDVGSMKVLEDPEVLDHWKELDEDLRIDFVFDTRQRRLACVSTVGLWELGLPELFLQPPAEAQIGNTADDARLAVFLATALIHLGFGLLSAEGFDVPPYGGDFDGRPVRFWLGAQEPPFAPLTMLLGPEVDTVIRVECSLWSTAGGGPVFPRCNRTGPMLN